MRLAKRDERTAAPPPAFRRLTPRNTNCLHPYIHMVEYIHNCHVPRGTLLNFCRRTSRSEYNADTEVRLTGYLVPANQAPIVLGYIAEWPCDLFPVSAFRPAARLGWSDSKRPAGPGDRSQRRARAVVPRRSRYALGDGGGGGEAGSLRRDRPASPTLHAALRIPQLSGRSRGPRGVRSRSRGELKDSWEGIPRWLPFAEI